MYYQGRLETVCKQPVSEGVLHTVVGLCSHWLVTYAIISFKSTGPLGQAMFDEGRALLTGAGQPVPKITFPLTGSE